MGLLQVTPPTREVVAISEARLHLRTLDSEDEIVALKVAQAREIFENETQRQLVTATWDMTLDDWGDQIPEDADAWRLKKWRLNSIILPRPPLQSITYIKYTDVNGVLQTLSTSVYEAVINVEPGRVRLKYDQEWPDHYDVEDAITIRFVSGYGTPEQVPVGIKSGILLITAGLYENREPINIGNIVNDLPDLKRVVDYYRIRSMP